MNLVGSISNSSRLRRRPAQSVQVTWVAVDQTGDGVIVDAAHGIAEKGLQPAGWNAITRRPWRSHRGQGQQESNPLGAHGLGPSRRRRRARGRWTDHGPSVRVAVLSWIIGRHTIPDGHVPKAAGGQHRSPGSDPESRDLGPPSVLFRCRGPRRRVLLPYLLTPCRA